METPDEKDQLIKSLQSKLDELKRLAPLCDEHGSGTGARSGCPYCALISMGAALGEIDYLCGEPNEMHVSGYDVHQNERAVLDHVRSRLDSLSSRLGALRECVDEWELDMHPDAISALRAILDDGPEPVVEIPIPICDWPGCDKTTGSTTRVRCDEHARTSYDRAPMIGPGRIPQT